MYIRIKFKQDVVNRYFQLLGVWRSSVRFISIEYVHVVVRIIYKNNTKLSTKCWFRCWIWDSNVQSNRKTIDTIGMNIICASPPAAYVADNFLVSFVVGMVGACKISQKGKNNTKRNKIIRNFKQVSCLLYLPNSISGGVKHVFLKNPNDKWSRSASGEICFVASLRRGELLGRNLKYKKYDFTQLLSVRLTDVENLLDPHPNQKTKENNYESSE